MKAALLLATLAGCAARPVSQTFPTRTVPVIACDQGDDREAARCQLADLRAHAP